MIRNLKKNAKWFSAIAMMALIAAVVAGYILDQQRLRFPLIEDKPVRMTAVLDDASSVTPGQGQTIQVAGVEIGSIASVKLREGRAVVGMDIEKRYADAGLIREDAKALLRPRTNLKDMYIQVFPGSRSARAAREGFEIPISRTLTDVDLDEILSSLDTRVRDYLTLFARGAGSGLRRRGEDLAEVFARFRPTFRDLARVNRAVAKERTSLRRLITSLAELNEELAEKPEDLTELVSASNATFGAFASEDDNLRETIRELPATLRQLRRTMGDVQPFADELGPASRALVPVTQALGRANPVVADFAREAEPLVRTRIRPFVREARPLTRDLGPAAEALNVVSPELRRSTRVLNNLFNMAAFNPGGKEGPEVRTREEGYLFWLAWVAHQGLNLQNIEDANGPMRPILITGTCTTLQTLVLVRPELEDALGLSSVLANVCGAANQPSPVPLPAPLAQRMVKEGPSAREEDR